MALKKGKALYDLIDMVESFTSDAESRRSILSFKVVIPNEIGLEV